MNKKSIPTKQKTKEKKTKTAAGSKSKVHSAKPILIEVAWEVCNQIGGIYTVIRSKIPAVIEHWQDDYCLVGPYFPYTIGGEFEETKEPASPFFNTVAALKKRGFDIRFGRWLVTGRPQVVLINPETLLHQLAEIKEAMWQKHGIDCSRGGELLEQAITFGFVLKFFFQTVCKNIDPKKSITAHFHEWLTAVCIPELRQEPLPIAMVFTTHATLLGRYIAPHDQDFYVKIPNIKWQSEAEKYNIKAQVQIERAASKACHCFTTVSQVTTPECMQFLDRKPDFILPNGLNIERFVALHEFQNLHQQYKQMIHQFVVGHFFPSYSFDLENTLYFFIAGRFEYRNKGFDLTLEALHLLNQRLKKSSLPVTVVMFFISKRPYHTINPVVLHSQILTEEIRNTCNSILGEIDKRLFYAVTEGLEQKLPPLNDFVDDYWKLRLRRTLHSWKTERLPIVVTHNLQDDTNDEILSFLRSAQLVNKIDDRVKIVYHPDFISAVNPLLSMDYGQFVRGCHLGIFPSFYEPWGYTPMECVANGIPTITSDLSGFGDYVQRSIKNHEADGIWVIKRRGKTYKEAVAELSSCLYSICTQTRRERIALRNAVEKRSSHFDWHNLIDNYLNAYKYAKNVLNSGS
ncbi:MAG: glycosyltransferase [Spirochaetales bacterium]|nr:glycosyltransferase [Spirochaetales bacterium]